MTLTLTLDRVILYTAMHHSLTSTNTPNFIKIDETFCGQTDVRTSERLLLGRLSWVDLKRSRDLEHIFFAKLTNFRVWNQVPDAICSPPLISQVPQFNRVGNAITRGIAYIMPKPSSTVQPFPHNIGYGEWWTDRRTDRQLKPLLKTVLFRTYSWQRRIVTTAYSCLRNSC